MNDVSTRQKAFPDCGNLRNWFVRISKCKLRWVITKQIHCVKLNRIFHLTTLYFSNLFIADRRQEKIGSQKWQGRIMSHGWEKDLLSSVFSAPIGKERGSNSWGLFICMCHCPESLAPQLITAGYSDTAWPLTALRKYINDAEGGHLYSGSVSPVFWMSYGSRYIMFQPS